MSSIVLNESVSAHHLLLNVFLINSGVFGHEEVAPLRQMAGVLNAYSSIKRNNGPNVLFAPSVIPSPSKFAGIAVSRARDRQLFNIIYSQLNGVITPGISCQTLLRDTVIVAARRMIESNSSIRQVVIDQLLQLARNAEGGVLFKIYDRLEEMGLYSLVRAASGAVWKIAA